MPAELHKLDIKAFDLRCMFIVLACFAMSGTAGADAGQCAGLEGSDGDLAVTAAESIEPAPDWLPDTESYYQPVPVVLPLCRVSATIEGNIGLELWLPQAPRWNGRLLAAGVGGPAGVFNYSDMSRRVNEGFASFSTDSGHKQSDTRWMADAKKLEDYTHRATHLSTLAAKQLVARYYGEPASHSYFLGCSGGGRQGLKEMQNYPADFDGIVAGAPGPNMPLQSVRMMWFALEQERNPDSRLDDADWDLYEREVTEACDALDGLDDGVIENPLACRFDTGSLACNDGQTENCLAPAQLAMLDAIAAPMLDERGEPMDYGLVPGVRTRPGPPSPLLQAMWADGVYDDPDWDALTFARTRDLERAHAMMPEMRADQTAIEPFIERGGKAIIYQGWADPSTVAGPTLNYYRKLAAAHGGYAALAKSVQLYMVPGMYHCRGGPGADQFGAAGHASWPGDPGRDVLWALIHWVEQGRQPERLLASKLEHEGDGFTHLLCPFPLAATVKPGARPDGAAGLHCLHDPRLARWQPPR